MVNNNTTRLTSRQMEVARALAMGHLQKQIAFNLGISNKTVDKHVQDIRERTGCRSNIELTHLALHKRWVKNMYNLK